MTNIREPDPRERRRTRIVRRIGVTIFTLVLVSAFAGLLGKGFFSKVTTLTAEKGLQAEHWRFVRYQAPMDLKLRISPQASENGLVRLQLSKIFVDEVEIDRIEPVPESQIAGPKFFTYTIRTETNATTEILIRFTANHVGRITYQVGLADGPKLHLQHFAFP